jgi:23S rRNA pseudouridine955/2504/2580 synthase
MQSILVNQDLASLRIDKLLCKKFDISFSLAQKLVREKKIKVNDKKADTNYKAQIGDTILVFVNLPGRIENNYSKPTISKQKQQKFWDTKIFEDENIVVINKPSGLATQGGTGIDISVDDFINLKNYQLVHRLDKDTSGLLLIAKNKLSADFLTNCFKNKTINKTYIALVYGNVKKESGTIDIPLAKKRIGLNEKVQADIEFGKPAITKYKVLKHFNDYTELELSPITGRTHQLRVHCKEIGHPILNDIKYGGKKVMCKDKFPRLCLHAYKINIEDYFGKNLNLQTPRPNFTLKI